MSIARKARFNHFEGDTMALRNINAENLVFSLSNNDVQETSTADPSFVAPGFVNDLDENLTKLWNSTIKRHYERLVVEEIERSRFFALDPKTVENGGETDAVKWAADPVEPKFCVDRQTAKDLSDWATAQGHPIHDAFGSKGRVQVQNEYCEYTVVYKKCKEDTDKEPITRYRPKRVLITTELREYWLLLAEQAPQKLQEVASSILGREVKWSELYGPIVTDPTTLSPEQRRFQFALWVAGQAGSLQDGDFKDNAPEEGVPVQPLGSLNRRNALFMTHQINGLDDLLYIVMFGARPYAKREGNQWVKASKEEIFTKEDRKELACRHADPAAATGAHDQAFQGKTVAFANPLGMYIRKFANNNFQFEGKAVPDEWIRYSRGKGEGYYQRLEFGPPDTDPHFLDDITVGDEPVIGGFQVLEKIEVGPLLVVGDGVPVKDEEYKKFEVVSVPDINCAQASICNVMRRLREDYQKAKERDHEDKVIVGGQ
jgi:hypothetical protein